MKEENLIERIPLVNVLFLAIINKYPNITGYDMQKIIPDIINIEYTFKTGTLYTQLRRLEKAGLVTSVQENSGRRPRKYQITEEGKKMLKFYADKIKKRVNRILLPLLKFIDESEIN